jgi:hypothetical protein
MSMKTGLIAVALAAFSLSGAALAADVAGAWKITGDVVGNAVDTVCTFTGAADKLSATCMAGDKPGPAAPVTVAGKDVTWDWATDQATLTFKGTLDTDKSMKGDIEVSGVTGSFTAAKQ